MKKIVKNQKLRLWTEKSSEVIIKTMKKSLTTEIFVTFVVGLAANFVSTLLW